MRSTYDRRDVLIGVIERIAREQAEAAVGREVGDGGRAGLGVEGDGVDLRWGSSLRWVWGYSAWRGGDVFAH